MLKRKKPLRKRTSEPERTRESDELVEEGLRAIYRDPSGARMDFGTLERRAFDPRKHAVVLIAICAAFIGLAGWVGSMLWQPFRGFHGTGLTLKIVGPENIAVGGEEIYHIQWANEDTHPLEDARVRFTFPPDFVPTSFQPLPDDRVMNAWNLGQLAPDAHGSIDVHGTFSGALGSQGSLQVLGTYRPATFNRDFESIVVQPITYTETVLEGRLQVPPKALAGDAVTVLYTLINHGTQAMQGLVAQFQPPEGFVIAAAQAASLDGSNVYTVPIGDLPPHASSTIRFVGSFASGVSGDLPFTVAAGRRGTGGAFFPAQKAEASIPVADGDLSLHFVANGSDADQTIQPGVPIHVSVAYQNTSIQPLKQIAVRVGLETFVNGQSATGTSLIDWPHVDSLPHAVSSTNARVQTLTFDQAHVSDFQSLDPQKDGTLELSIPTLPVASGTRDAWIRISVEATVPDGSSAHVVQAQPLTVRYRTDADLGVEARYFTEEGAPLGFGPLPPVAGKTTAYRVFWHLTKRLHPLESVSVSARLPLGAAWSARAMSDVGVLSYDPATRVVSWNIDALPDGSSDLEASFEVQVTPDTNDIDRFAAILGETTFQAQDDLLHESVSKTKPPVTTDLQNDDGARGKGVVRKP